MTGLQRYKNYNDTKKLDTEHYPPTTTQRRTNNKLDSETLDSVEHVR